MKKQTIRIISLALLAAMLLASFSGCGHVHDYGDWKVKEEPTCTEEGRKVRVCDCGERDSKSIEPLGHTDGEWVVTVEATCVEDGSKKLYCDECNELIRTEPIAAAGKHDYASTVTTEASCWQDGVTTYTCNDCQDSYDESFACPTYTSTEIYDMYLNSVGEVVTYDKNGDAYSLGTCFVYTQDGKVITNYHVIEDSYSATVTLGDAEYTVQQVLAYDKDIDLAVLQLSAYHLTPVKMCSYTHKVGAVVYAFGNSQGLTSTFSDGMITYSDRVIDGVVYTQHDAPISSGNSGGPLINEYGEVIGINTWTVQDSQNLNFAINVSELDNLDYSNPMSMAEFYETECNAFVQMKNYIVTYGTYDSSEGCYYVTFGTDYSSDYTTKGTRRAYYYVDADAVTLDCLINDGDYWLYFIIYDDVSGEYTWKYFDTYDITMDGTLYASTFTSDTLLEVYSISDSSQISTYRELASSMAVLICSTIAKDWAAVGITADDLGFLYF